jgi:hypothetical protein
VIRAPEGDAEILFAQLGMLLLSTSRNCIVLFGNATVTIEGEEGEKARETGGRASEGRPE